MGNQVGVPREPPHLSDLLASQITDTARSFGGGGGVKEQGLVKEDGFKSYLQIWRFYADSEDDVLVKNCPVRFAQFRKFESKDCYIAVHLIKNVNNMTSASVDSKAVATSPRGAKGESPRGANIPSLCDLLVSSFEELTPRGTSCSFGTLYFEPFIHNANEEYTHDLYVWNGKKSTPLVKAVTLAKGFEIERTLMQGKVSGSLPFLFSKSPKSSLSSIFVDDLTTFNKQDPSRAHPHDTVHKFETNHIYKQLFDNSKSKPTTVKIGELFAAPPDGPRYEVLRKLMHAQSNGLTVVTKADSPTKSTTSIAASLATTAAATTTTNNKVPPLLSVTRTVPPLSFATKDSPRTTAAKLEVPALKLGGPSRTGMGIKLPITSIQPHPSETSSSSSSSSSCITNTPFERATPQQQAEYNRMPQLELQNIFGPVLSPILDNLYLGGQKPASDKQMLQKAGITHVLNCAGKACEDYFPDTFVYKTYDIGDGVTEDISCLFYESLEFIEEAIENNGKVLIHCHQGISRSSAFVICYLMWKNKWEFRQAHEYTKEVRWIAAPNAGFIGQLLLWRKWLDSHKREVRMFRMMAHSRSLVVPKLVETKGYAALDPRGCFIVQTPDSLFIWIGERCPQSLLEGGRRTATRIRKYENGSLQIIEVNQNAEPQTFWESIGGDGPVTEVALYNSEFLAPTPATAPAPTPATSPPAKS